MRQHKRPSPKLALALLAAGLAALAPPGLPAGPPPADAGLMVSNLGAPPEWRRKGWGRMSAAAPGFMSKSKTLQIPAFLLQIWGREIAENDRWMRETSPAVEPYKDGHAHAGALWSVYRDGGRTVVASLLDAAKFCGEGPSDINSGQVHSLCPVRLTVIEGQSVKSADYPGGCFLDTTFDSAPGEPRHGPDPAANASLSRYDRQAGVVELAALRDGKPLPECARRLALPK